MAFDGSAIRALLDGAVAKGAVHGMSALVVDRHGAVFHHAAGEANGRTLYRNASMTKAVATWTPRWHRSCRSSASCSCWKASTVTHHACGHRPARPRCAS